MIDSRKTPITRFLMVALLLATPAHTLSASPFDPRFVITVDELCSDGSLALSIPLMRVRLDDSTTITLRAEHVLRTGDYGFAQSEIVVRPLHTTLTPYDRDALVWRKPNGEKTVLRKSAGKLPKGLPDETREILDSAKTFRTYESHGVTAWLAENSLAWGLVRSEGILFSYEDGALTWFMLPSGNRVLVKSNGATISELRIEDEILFSFEQITETEARIVAGTRRFGIRYDRGRIVEIERLPVLNLPATKLMKFNYGPDGLLATTTFNGKQRHYAWAKTKRPLPPIINWVNSHHLQSADDRRFDYIVTNDTITMISFADEKPRKTTRLRVRYGAIMAIREEKK
jgi:hypothetical protein